MSAVHRSSLMVPPVVPGPGEGSGVIYPPLCPPLSLTFPIPGPTAVSRCSAKPSAKREACQEIQIRLVRFAPSAHSPLVAQLPPCRLHGCPSSEVHGAPPPPPLVCGKVRVWVLSLSLVFTIELQEVDSPRFKDAVASDSVFAGLSVAAAVWFCSFEPMLWNCVDLGPDGLLPGLAQWYASPPSAISRGASHRPMPPVWVVVVPLRSQPQNGYFLRRTLNTGALDLFQFKVRRGTLIWRCDSVPLLPLLTLC